MLLPTRKEDGSKREGEGERTPLRNEASDATGWQTHASVRSSQRFCTLGYLFHAAVAAYNQLCPDL